MDITPPVAKDVNLITAYSKEGVRIRDQLFLGSILLSAKKVINWGENKSLLDLEDYKEVIEFISSISSKTSVVLLVGTGEKSLSPPMNIIKSLAMHNIAAEFMTTSAACRTYNILISEEREVAALLTF